MYELVPAWVIVLANLAAAGAFLYIGSRFPDRLLIASGTGSLIAGLAVAAQAPPLRITPENPWAYTLGFLTSVIGFFELVLAYESRRRR